MIINHEQKNVYSVFRATPPSIGFALLSDAAGGSGSPSSTTGGTGSTDDSTGSSSSSGTGKTTGKSGSTSSICFCFFVYIVDFCFV